MISFGPDLCGDWAQATSREWLETNGLGGYASSTIVGANTRRYHGLLIAALRPPTQRTLLLSKLEETLAIGSAEYDLSCNQYPGTIYPQGYRHLREFRLDPFPTFVYEAGGARLEKTVAMCQCLNAVVVRYRLLEGPGTVSLLLRPIVNCRDHHHLMRENATFSTRVEVMGARDRVSIQPFPGVAPLVMEAKGGYFEPYGYWYRSFEYAREEERGLDFREDQYSPGFFARNLESGETAHFVASLGGAETDPAVALQAETDRRTALVASWQSAPDDMKTLVCAADQFLVRRAEESKNRGVGITLQSPISNLGRSSVIAGYHWFEEWGRDTMIALPGLTLVTGRYGEARSILRSYAALLDEGLIPNRIPNAGEQPDYNTADATLWMFWAARKYLDYSGDKDFVRGELLPVLLDVIDWMVRGTKYSIRVDTDGLLSAGNATTQLTWMDAKVGDWVVTPRHGKPVEINALWHHALWFVEELAGDHKGPSAAAVADVFRTRFWNEEAGYLNDVVDREGQTDTSLRPNQVIALSLSPPLLDGDRARRLLEAVERELLTPYGLRTLSPRNPQYRGAYVGDQWSRDGAYHQGTVWPWLLGPFITAYVSIAEDKDAARARARRWLEPMWAHLCEAGVGQLSEIFDGDAPHTPRGCIAQAWSVAEVLRAAVEDVGMASAVRRRA